MERKSRNQTVFGHKTALPCSGVLLSAVLLFRAAAFGCACSGSSLGLFDSSRDVGETAIAGQTEYDPSGGNYRLTGSGENIWYHSDAFHFAWKEIVGDVELNAQVEWTAGTHPHRKAGWMIRQSMAHDAAYADAVVHGSGAAALQFRRLQDGPTMEVPCGLPNPPYIRLLRHGRLFTMSVSEDGKTFEPVGTVVVPMSEPVYAGLIVCSHDNTQTAQAVFKNISIRTRGLIEEKNRMLESSLEIFNIQTGRRRVVFSTTEMHIEAPNWSPDGKTLLFNSGGRLYTIPVEGSTPKLLNTSFADRCNNDHGFAPDGKWIFLSHDDNGVSKIYRVPSKGGRPRLITPQGPSYWHGISPDGKTAVYCAQRGRQYDIYAVDLKGGPERQLTNTPAHEDGPDYSPDGKFIYFNSDREGPMFIWRMNADGTNPVLMTFDDQYNDWFPHPSPDGKWIVFLSYHKSVKGHPAQQEVVLRLLPTDQETEPKTLTRLFGGQGTLNVPSWSPDSRQFAFVSYQFAERENH